MDVHDGPAPEHAGEARGRSEPPGHDAGAAGDAGDSGDPQRDRPGAGDSSDGYDLAGAVAGSGPASGPGTMTVEVEGRSRELPAERDYTGDGQADAVVETADGKVIVFVDTEDNDTGEARPDGKADEAYVVDKETGQVVATARIDPGSGTWVRGTDGDPEAEQAADADGGREPEVAHAHADPTTGERRAGPASGPGAEGGTTVPAGTMTVRVDGRTQQLPVERDYTGDGQADAAVETGDGQVIVFVDTEDNDTGEAGPDGRPDAAWIIDKSTGRVVGAARVDERTGEWVDGAGTDGPLPSGGSS